MAPLTTRENGAIDELPLILGVVGGVLALIPIIVVIVIWAPWAWEDPRDTTGTSGGGLVRGGNTVSMRFPTTSRCTDNAHRVLLQRP